MEAVITLALDTIAKKKQALVFVNTRNSAEKQAEDISKKTPSTQELIELSEKIKNALPSPTKQCIRLANCIKSGIAFHHSGLHSKQRELIENSFRIGTIKIICCTPTLAAGLDLPAFRAIIKDVKRFTFRGMDFIPVLEYLQMAGRAGRPKYDTEGEAILIAKNEREFEELMDRYIHGEPESIYSKLAAEPVLRTYVLSLLAVGMCKTHTDLIAFFQKTFFGHQYSDESQLQRLVDYVLLKLEEWEFLTSTQGAFTSANEVGQISVTKLGKRVAELYLDPYTAHQIIERLEKKQEKTTLAYLQAIAHTLEMRPLLRVKAKEREEYEELLAKKQDDLLEEVPFEYDEYEELLNSLKTASFLERWIQETSEDKLLEEFGIRPGEIRVKLDVANWLLFSAEELGKIRLFPDKKNISLLRTRIQKGVKEELLPLVRLTFIGRSRARKLFSAGIKNAKDLRNTDKTTLKQLLGEKTAEKVLHELTYN